MLAYDLGHPTGDSPCYIIPSGTDVSLVAFESLVRVLAELAHVSDKTRAFPAAAATRQLLTTVIHEQCTRLHYYMCEN